MESGRGIKEFCASFLLPVNPLRPDHSACGCGLLDNATASLWKRAAGRLIPSMSGERSARGALPARGREILRRERMTEVDRFGTPLL